MLRPFPDLLHILHTRNLHNQGLLGGKATLNLDELLEKALLNLLMMDGAHLKKKRIMELMNAKKIGATLHSSFENQKTVKEFPQRLQQCFRHYQPSLNWPSKIFLP